MTVSAPALLRPSYYSTPDRAYTLGPEVAELVALTSDDKGPFVMDPEQRMLLDDWFGYTDADRLASFEGVVIDNRQNKKTGTLKAAALGKLFICEQRLVVWSAHEFFASREAFRDLRIMLESAPDLDREVLKVWTGAGAEAIEFTGDRRLIFKARTTGSGRSLSGDTVILDEGFALQPEHMGALVPTLAARPDPQLLIGSSAGMKTSGVLRSMRDRGRAGRPRLSYAEWTATLKPCEMRYCPHLPGTEGCGYDDQETWAAVNTAITRGRMSIETVAGMRQSMPPEQFARECVGQWDDPETGGGIIPATAWQERLSRASQIVTEPVLVLDVSPMSTWACIVGGGINANGRVHVEITSDGKTLDYRPGTDWVVELLAGRTVHIVAGSAAESLTARLEAAGATVEVMPRPKYAAACVAFVANLPDHLGQPELTAAVLAGDKRTADEGLWVWGRGRSSQDITPLVGATAAAALAVAKRPSVYESRGLLSF